MEELLSMTFLGKPVERWLVAAAYIAGGLVVGLVASWILKNVFRRIFARTKTRFDDILLASIEKPLVAIVVLLGIRMGIDVLTLDPGVAPWVGKTIAIFITAFVASAIAKLLQGLIDEYLVPYVRKTEGNLDDQILPIARKTVSIAVWTIAALCAIRESGYDIGAILAGLGIGGVAIALAAKDTLSNFFGSVAVFIDRPFMINDRIKVAGFDGTIVDIGIRTSRIRTLDNRIVTLPNSVFTAGAIENVSSEPSTKVSNLIQLDASMGYEKAARAVALLREMGDRLPGLAKGTIAALTGFGESSYDVTFIVFVEKGADYFAVLNSLNLELLKRFAEEGIRLATPTRAIVERRERS